MDVEVAITLVDSLVFQETGQHLSSIEINLLRGIWLNQSYEELTETCYCSIAHLKMVGSAFWTLLSKIFGEKVTKRKVRAILESYYQDRKTGKLRKGRKSIGDNRFLRRWDDIKTNKSVGKANSWFHSDLLLRLTDRLDHSLKTIPTCVDADLSQFKSLTEKLRLICSLSADNYPYTPTTLDILDICRNLLDDFQVDFPHRKITLSLFEEPVLPHYNLSLITLIDEQLVRYILKHLLFNALQYSASESLVTLDVNVEAEQGILTIADQGVGIPPEELEQIFQPFYCATNARQWSGDGLGLSIVQKSIGLHRGDISVASEVDNGSIFTVILPIV